MRYRTYGRSALETRVDYVESRLDDTIGYFKDAITDLKEAIKENKVVLCSPTAFMSGCKTGKW